MRLTDESSPEPPKRAMTAYLIFCSKHRERVMREVHGDDGARKFSRDEMQLVTTRLAEMWNNISEKEKKEVHAKAAAAKAEYEMQKAAFSPALLKKLHRLKSKPKGTVVVEAQGEKPVRAKTAYLIFCGKHRAAVMRKIHPEPEAKFTRAEMQQVTTELAALWKNISPQELAECKAAAAKELERYKQLKAEYRPPVYGPSKRNKGKSVPGKPKRAPTAYLIFAEELRARIRQERPHLKHDEISQKLSTAWKEIDEASKRIFQQKADAIKADLMQNMPSSVMLTGLEHSLPEPHYNTHMYP